MRKIRVKFSEMLLGAAVDNNTLFRIFIPQHVQTPENIMKYGLNAKRKNAAEI